MIKANFDLNYRKNGHYEHDLVVPGQIWTYKMYDALKKSLTPLWAISGYRQEKNLGNPGFITEKILLPPLDCMRI